MAYIEQHKYCTHCEREYTFVNGQCTSCLEKLARTKVASWNAQTVEEKLQDLRKRVEQLEAPPPTY